MSDNLEKERTERLETRVALTTSIIAVFLAISSILGSNADNNTLLKQGDANNKWSYFQSKSIKQNLLENHLDMLSLEKERPSLKNEPELLKALEQRMATAQKDIDRYEKEKQEIKKNAEADVAEADKLNALGDNYDLAEGFYQVSLIMAALALIAKRNAVWVFSATMGGIAIGITLLTLTGIM